MNPVALVTGGGRGIGQAIALALADEGIAIAVAARTTIEVERVAASIRTQGRRALAVTCDVTDPTNVAAAVARVREQMGPITILVNNAGAAGSHRFSNHDDDLWHRMIDTNLNSVYYATKAVIPMMVAAQWGRIVNIASVAAQSGAKYLAAYTAAKHGVLGLTRALAAEYATLGITVNAVCPGYVDTPMTEQSIAAISGHTRKSPAEVRTMLERMNPQNRLISAEEVATVVVMLIGDNARGISGQAISIDGGSVMA